MLIYANSFWFEPAGGPAEIIQFIAKWVSRRSRSRVDGERLADGIRELKLRDGSVLTSNTTCSLAGEVVYPYLFSAQLSHRDDTVSGRKWITEVGLRQEAAGQPVEVDHTDTVFSDDFFQRFFIHFAVIQVVQRL